MVRRAVLVSIPIGIKRFIDKGDVVCIKPNVGFDRGPELGVDHNPQLSRGRETLLEAAPAR